MTTTAVPNRSVTARPAVRSKAPSLPTLVALEARKSLSTRSGTVLAALVVVLAPAATLLAATAATGRLDSVVGPLALAGTLTAYLVLSLGVLSTAGEWSHRTVQTTFLLTPQRGRVTAAKALAVGALAAVLSAAATGLAAGVLALTEAGAGWDGVWRAVAAAVAAGVVFAVTGVGIGAALGNTPAALTGLYVLVLGVMPVLETVKPTLARHVDPANAVLDLARGVDQVPAALVLAGWVVISLVAGAVLSSRHAVQ